MCHTQTETLCHRNLKFRNMILIFKRSSLLDGHTVNELDNEYEVSSRLLQMQFTHFLPHSEHFLVDGECERFLIELDIL